MTTATPLAQYRAADSTRRREAVQRTLHDMVAAGEFVSVSEVARRAGVHRSFLYRHPDLHAAIENHPASGVPAPLRADRISTASLKTAVSNEQERNRRLTARLHQLERRLSEALGREAFHDAGLDLVDETHTLQLRVQDLEGEVVDLRLKLREAEDVSGRPWMPNLTPKPAPSCSTTSPGPATTASSSAPASSARTNASAPARSATRRCPTKTALTTG